MRHAKKFRKLSRHRSHYRAMVRNMAFSLFQHERIQTTLPKAKEARRFIERIITLGKKGSLHDRRNAMALMGNKMVHNADGTKTDVVGKVFGELANRYKNRTGGYTRIYRLARERSGDAAPMAILELVDAPESMLFKDKTEAEETEASDKKTKKKAKKSKTAESSDEKEAVNS